MRSHLDAKAMAKTLRSELTARRMDVSHSDCLEITARMFGFRDWNTMTSALAPNDGSTGKTMFLPLPEGWSRSGRAHQQYRAGVVAAPGDTDARCFCIASQEAEAGGKLPDPDDFCTIMQAISATAFRGSRIRFGAELKSHDVHGSVTIWMRVDDVAGKTLTFDNREKAGPEGAITGTTDWAKRAVILDVPTEAESIKIGVYLSGRGMAWARAFSFGVTEETATHNDKNLPPAPLNLSL